MFFSVASHRPISEWPTYDFSKWPKIAWNGEHYGLSVLGVPRSANTILTILKLKNKNSGVVVSWPRFGLNEIIRAAQNTPHPRNYFMTKQP